MDQRDSLLAELDEVTRWLAERATDAPDNFLHLLLLIEAERAWAADDFRAAALAFNAARCEVAQRQRPWHRALIAEHAALFYLARGVEEVGHDLLAQARQGYLAWGATAKVAQLDWAYPKLRTPAGPIAADGSQSGERSRDRAVVTTGTVDLLGIVSATQALSSETSIGRLHARVAEVLSAMTGATGVHLLLWSEDRQGWLRPAPDGGGTVPVSRTGHESAVPTSVLRYARRTREPLVVADAARDDRFAGDPYFAGLTRCSVLAVPVLSRGALRAVLLLENRLLGGAFTARRLNAVNLIAGQLAVSLDNAQLYAEVGRIAGEQAALRRVATLVARAAAAAEVFAAVTEEAGRLLHADHAWMVRYDPDGSRTMVASWSSTGAAVSVGGRARLGGRNLATLIFHTGQPARIDDYADASGPAASIAQEMGFGASVDVPISVEGRLWGVLAVAAAREPLPDGTEARLAGFTELVATAIANAQAQADLAASRRRILAVGDETRRRIERDLHDGVQQHLVTLAMMLSGIRDRVPADVRADVDEVRDELAATRRGAPGPLPRPASGHPGRGRPRAGRPRAGPALTTPGPGAGAGRRQAPRLLRGHRVLCRRRGLHQRRQAREGLRGSHRSSSGPTAR